MPVTLVVNHHSLSDDNCVANSFDKSCAYLKDFFSTWQHAIDKEICEKYITCDTEIWNWELGEEKSMYDYIGTLKRDAQLLAYNLLKITKKSSLEYFSDEILEIVTTKNVVTDDEKVAHLIGCACLTENSVLLSLCTSSTWKNSYIEIDWGNNNTFHQLYPLCQNFSCVEHVDSFYEEFQKLLPITSKTINELLPSVDTTPPFWDWFNDLSVDVQHFLIDKARFCADSGWVPRDESAFKTLKGTRNNLTEIRAWPVGKTLRIYTKKASDKKVIFLGGSDKSEQDEAIKAADKYYTDNFKSSRTSK